MEVLENLENGSIELRTVPAAVFFNQLWTDTKDGFLSDPSMAAIRIWPANTWSILGG